MPATREPGAGVAQSQADEGTLVEAAQRGDGDALRTLLVAFTEEVRGRIAGQIGRRHRSLIDAWDVVQVTLIEAFLRIKQFRHRGTGSFLAWLTRAAENNLLDAVRAFDREKRRPRPKAVKAQGDVGSWMRLADTLARSSFTPSRIFSRKEAREFLQEAIPKLPPLYRRVIELYDLGGLSAKEVGRLLDGRSDAAVYMLSARAHEHLGDLLGSWGTFFSSKG